VSLTAESAGANCSNGGVKIQTGIDLNDDGVLEPNEVNATETQYVCSGIVSVNPGGLDAGTGMTCSTGVMTCNGFCVDLQIDNANCGACGNACAAGSSTCVLGQCQCSDGGIVCNGSGDTEGAGQADASLPNDAAADGAASNGVLLMLAGGPLQVVAGEYTPGSGWTSTILSGATANAPALAVIGHTSGVAMIGSTSGNGQLLYTTWTSEKGWSALGEVSSTAATNGPPSLVAVGGVAYGVFRATNSMDYLAVWDGSSWNPSAEPVMFSGGRQSFGPSAPTITALGTDVVIAYAGPDGDLHDQSRTSGYWQTANGHDISAQHLSVTPTIVAPTAAADLMIVYVRGDTNAIWFTTRSADVWASPSNVDLTAGYTSMPVSLAALPNGEVLMAFTGQDGKVYWSRYTPGTVPPWTQPAAITTPNYSTVSPPSVVPGLGSATAELLFVDSSSNAAKHTRLFGGVWSTPVSTGATSVTYVAATAAP
jgi:hypothetical protein